MNFFFLAMNTHRPGIAATIMEIGIMEIGAGNVRRFERKLAGRLLRT